MQICCSCLARSVRQGRCVPYGVVRRGVSAQTVPANGQRPAAAQQSQHDAATAQTAQRNEEDERHTNGADRRLHHNYRR